MLFLVKGTLRIRRYMADSDIVKNVSNLVEAFDSYDASDKFEKYYRDKTSEYDVSYYVGDVSVSETIL